LKNRGVSDVLIVCCDGLKGLPDAIEAVWPKATIQTCVVHLLRASFRYAAWDTRSKIAAALRPIYTAASADDAEQALDTFEAEWGDRYPAIVRLWRDAWEVFTPFLAYPPEIRRVVYTTDVIVNPFLQVCWVASARRGLRRPVLVALRSLSQHRVAA